MQLLLDDDQLFGVGFESDARPASNGMKMMLAVILDAILLLGGDLGCRSQYFWLHSRR